MTDSVSFSGTLSLQSLNGNGSITPTLRNVKIPIARCNNLIVNGITATGGTLIQGLHSIKISGNTVIPTLYINGVLYTPPYSTFSMNWTGTGMLALPTISTGSYSVNWGDGSITNNSNVHTYSGSVSTYTIQITGSSLRSIKSFNNSLTSNITSIPTIGYSITDMNDMFPNCSLSAQVQLDMGSWDTSNVKTMANIFGSSPGFNGNVTTWNTINVNNMAQMFANTPFNQDLYWNTSNVTNMQSMFILATAFNKPLNFDTRKVTTMSGMFSFAYAFNNTISSFDTINVTNMQSMFQGTANFNQSLSNFNTSNVTNMQSMFNSSAFNNTISSFDTINVTSMVSMFASTSAFNQPLGHFNTSNVTNMQSMFNFATGMSDANFDTLKNWNVSKVDTFSAMISKKMSNVVMSNILAGWATSGTGVKPNLVLGVNISQRAIGTTSDIQTYYTAKNWKFFSGSTQIPIDTFFSATS